MLRRAAACSAYRVTRLHSICFLCDLLTFAFFASNTSSSPPSVPTAPPSLGFASLSAWHATGFDGPTIPDHSVRLLTLSMNARPLPASSAATAMSPRDLAVSVRRASVIYPAADAPVQALHEVDLTIAPGEFVA